MWNYALLYYIVKMLFVEIYFTVLLYCWRAVCGGWLEEKTMGWQPAKSQLCKVIIGQRCENRKIKKGCKNSINIQRLK